MNCLRHCEFCTRNWVASRCVIGALASPFFTWYVCKKVFALDVPLLYTYILYFDISNYNKSQSVFCFSSSLNYYNFKGNFMLQATLSKNLPTSVLSLIGWCSLLYNYYYLLQRNKLDLTAPRTKKILSSIPCLSLLLNRAKCSQFSFSTTKAFSYTTALPKTACNVLACHVPNTWTKITSCVSQWFSGVATNDVEVGKLNYVNL